MNRKLISYTRYEPLLVLIFASAFIASCGKGGDGISDSSLDDAMIREAGCVVASEKFGLYDEAKRHFNHGNEFGAKRYKNSNYKIQNNFMKLVEASRDINKKYSNYYFYKVLKNQCDYELKDFEYRRVE